MRITLDNYQQIFADLNVRLSELEGSSNKNVNAVIKKIKDKTAEVCQGGDILRQENGILKIGVVGQVKAGKSSFLNSLIFNGESVLPRASTPMTAGLTILKYGEENQFEVEYYNSAEWRFFEDKSKEYDDIIQSYRQDNSSLSENDIVRMANIDSTVLAAKEMVTACSRVARNNILDKSKVDVRQFSDATDLQDILEEYVGAKGKFTSIVKSLTIKLHDERLQGIQIVDTPGVNDPVLSREQRTREFLRECHGVFFLSYSGRFFDSTDVTFLTDRIGSQGIGTVVLIASKFDSVLQDVGMKYKDDFFNALEYCQHALKKQYQTNIATSHYNGKDPIVDFSSGIGFSIANKDESRWDDVESHVVKQMKMFYPSVFSESEDVRGMFMNLSNIDDIREKYMEGTFKANKERIIEEKVNAYFANANDALRKIFTSERKKLVEESEYLERSDIGYNEERKKLFESIVNHIEKDMSSIRNRADDVIEKCKKECRNDFHLSWNGVLPVESCTLNIKIGSLIKKDVSYEYEIVDLDGVIQKVTGIVKERLSTLEEEWKKKNSNIQDDIRKLIGEVITENEEKDTQNLLDTRVLRNILEEVLSGMANKSTLDTCGINLYSLTTALQGIEPKPKVKQKYKSKEEVEDDIREKVNKCKDNIRARILSFISSVNEDVEGIIKQAAENSINVLKDKKEEFIKSVHNSIDEYLENLEHQLLDKKNQLEIMTNVINELSKIETYYEKG